MNDRIIRLAQTILASEEKADVEQLIKILQHFNRFDGDQRARFMTNEPNGEFEEAIKKSLEKTVGSDEMYVSGKDPVCPYCGK